MTRATINHAASFLKSDAFGPFHIFFDDASRFYVIATNEQLADLGARLLNTEVHEENTAYSLWCSEQVDGLVDDERLRDLRDEAREAGDEDMVATCDDAISGCVEAAKTCAEAIVEAMLAGEVAA